MALEANTGSSTITTLGTIGTGTWNGTTIGVAYGGTGLSSIASGVIMYTSGADTIATSTITAAGRAILDDADAAAQLTTLGLTATAAELNYTDGVTSAIQTQLDAKQGTLTNSAGLLAALSDETGTGVAVFSTSPSFTTPALGAATATSIAVGSGGTAITKHLSVTQANVVSASIATVTCGNYGTITVTGAAVGDTVIVSPTAVASGIETLNLGWSAAVTGANTVTIRACNPTAGAIDALDTQTWRADVWQH
ncbi:hypothetical protein HY798_03835 [Candidatus Falkowbacteria bacterium]|nr:hypothetical protein [Candidatus Falkowbacteria bacterium]